MISALSRKRPFLPGDVEAHTHTHTKKAVFSSLLHVPSVCHERKDERGFPCEGLRTLGAGRLGREQGFPEWSSSVIEGRAAGLFS